MARHSKGARGRDRTRPVVLALTTAALLGSAFPVGSALADPIPLPLPPLPSPLGPGLDVDPGCSTATQPFIPTTVTIPELDETVPVIGLHRDGRDVPGTAPTTREGKTVMAFDLDSGIRPGDPEGNALLNAHTWPDGTAIGNSLLADLDEGDRVVAASDHGTICYQVSERVEVPADSREAAERYFASTGPPQLAIVVCSGQRLGPGEWTHRTIWYAAPLP